MLFRKKAVLIASFFGLLIGLAIAANWYFKMWTPEKLPEGQLIFVNEEPEGRDSVHSPESVDYKIEEVVRGLYVPWSIVFTSDTRMLVTERNGTIREVVSGVLTTEPLLLIPDVSTESEEGLMGMALDPQYDENKLLYICYAYPDGDDLYDKVVVLEDIGTALEEKETILDAIPAARNHAGCRLRFGPDEKLYITTGDATDRNIAQDTDSLGGKILRINSDGSIPADNPFGNAVWSYGHRNPQGIDWHPSGVMYATEHGPSGFDGPGGGDEVNVIKKGSNYGWPLVSHEESMPSAESPKLVFTPAFAPASGMFYTSNVLPQFTNNFFIGGLRGQGIMRIIVSDSDAAEVVAYEKLPNIPYGRIREIVEGPDGSIYFTTSNRDGRGSVQDGDDKILRITPQ